MATLTLEQLVKYVQELPALPDTAIKVLKMTDDPTVSARDIANTIANDLALTSRVLKIANSAFYGMPRSVSTVNEAVIILGMQALRNLALAAAAYDTLSRESAGYGLSPGELWRHSISCAMAAQIVAKKSRAVRTEEAFVAGLLHDVGKVILGVHVQPQYQAILALTELDEMPFHEAEKYVLGFDHAEVGQKIGEKWNLPPTLCAAIAGHHCLERGDEAPKLTAVVHVANAVCLMEGLGIGGDGLRSYLDPTALALLELTERDVEVVMDEMVQQMEHARPMFEIK